MAERCHTFGEARTLENLPEQIVKDVEHFFRSYNAPKEIEFSPLRRGGAAVALALVKSGIQKADQAAEQG